MFALELKPSKKLKIVSAGFKWRLHLNVNVYVVIGFLDYKKNVIKLPQGPRILLVTGKLR